MHHSAPEFRPSRAGPTDLTVLMLAIAFLHIALNPSSAADALAAFRTDTSAFAVDASGSLSTISRRADNRIYLAPSQPAPLLTLRAHGRVHTPHRAEWDAPGQQLTLHYGAGGTATRVFVKVLTHPSHLAFEVVGVEPKEGLEWAAWGPYPTTIREIIGETVGVVRDAEFAIGIQALNAKTLGGYPSSESDDEAGTSEDDLGTYGDLPTELLAGQGYRTDTARRTPFGSVLQAYCRQRDHDRILPNWGHEKYPSPAYPDGGVVGSRIALFACPASQALNTIGTIETTEGLPHPLIDGAWGKTSLDATASYLIVDFSEENVDRAIEMTRRAGLRYLYHSSPFETWGHFRLKPGLFPHGWDGLKACVQKAAAVGVRVGVHTLSNFITPNDAYVSPRPDPRLARIGASTLLEEIDASRREIPVADTNYFAKSSAMNTVLIGEELIRFGAVSKDRPWRLLECERGAWGTRAAAHPRDSQVARLLDHDYKVFLSEVGLSVEIAHNLADLFNQAGLQQLSFDGLEGNWSTGLGKYGCALFTQAWHDALTPALRGQVINDASLPGHFSWHIHTRMNWGEPWYGGFRESQTLYRFKNQVYFERNLMPRMLGWFALRADTSLEDAEWLLARAAGFNAGFTLATSLASTAQLEADPLSADTARRFGATTVILETIRQWETARRALAFPESVRALLRDSQREFRLRSIVPAAQWELREAHLQRFAHDAGASDPSDFTFTNVAGPQPLNWVLRSTAKEAVEGLSVTLRGRSILELKNQLVPPGGSVRYDGGSEAVIADAAWKEVARVPVIEADAAVDTGNHPLTLRCSPRAGATLKLEARTFGPPTRLAGTRAFPVRP